MNEQEDINNYLNIIETRLLDSDSKRVFQRLMLYRKIIVNEEVSIEEQNLLAQSDLQRFGLIVKRSEQLQVNSRIHQEYFNLDWVETQLQTNTIYKRILLWAEDKKSLKKILCTLALTWREPIRNSELEEWVDELVQTQVIENWESKNEEQHYHLRRIRDEIIDVQEENIQRVCQHLIICSQILDGELIPQQNLLALEDLLNIGLLVKNNEKIQLACQIYQFVFNQNWVEQELSRNSIFQEISYWSEGDMSLKRELCQLVLTLDKPSDKSATEWINELVNSQIVHNWKQGRKEYQQRWQQIRDNLLDCPRRTLRLALRLYKQILQESEVEADNSSPECIELLSSGLAIIIESRLKVSKHIYPLVFNRDWVEEELNAPTPMQLLWDNYTQKIKVFLRKIWLYLFELLVLVTILLVLYNILQLNIYKNRLYESVNIFKEEQLNALFSAIESVDELSEIVPVYGKFILPKYLSVSPSFILQSILSKIYEQNQFEAKDFHDFAIRSVSFSQDGQHLASGGEDGSLRLWNLSDPAKNIVILPKKVKQGNVMSVSFSPKEDLIAIGGQWEENKNPTVRLWDFSGKPKGEPVPIDKSGKITSVIFSPDGQLIATLGGQKGLVKLWQIQPGYKLKEIDKIGAYGNNEIKSVSFKPIKNFVVIVTAENPGIVKLWEQSADDKKRFKPRTIIDKQQDAIKSVIFSPDGNYIATSGKNGTVILWDSQGNQRSYPLEIDKGEQPNINFTPDGKFLATTLQNGNIQLWKLPILETTNTGDIGDFKANKWELKDKKVDDELNGHKKRVHSISFSPKYQDSDSKYLATGGSDSTVRLWNLSKLYKQPFIDGYENENIKSIVIGKVSSDDKTQRMVILQEDGKVKLNSAQFIDLNRSAKTKNINISPDREHLVTVESLGENSIVKLWDFSGNRQGNSWPIEKRAISSVILSADNKYCLLFEENGKASIWEFSGKEYPFKKIFDYKVKTASFSPNEQIVAAVLKNDEIKLWNLKGEIINENFISSSNVEKVEFSPDGKFIATIENDQKMKLWKIVKKGSQFSTRLNHKFNVDGVTTFNFSPTTATEELIATSGDNKVIKIWDFSGRQIAEFHGDWNRTVSLSFTPDGTQIAAAGDNGKIEQWEIKTLDKLLADSCDWLKDYFSIPSHKQKLEKVDVCKKQYMNQKNTRSDNGQLTTDAKSH